jgi:hypothetical protein
MRRAGITFVGALALVAVASVCLADKARCKVKIGDEYRILESTYTKGGCEVEAKKYAGPRVCDSGEQYFDLRYSFDDTVYEATHLHCKLYMGSATSSSAAEPSDVPERASANGKYRELIQVVNCPSHVEKWGEFNDYGHWGGGPWCGQTGKEGYWVWLAPKWYVWAEKASAETPARASVDGKYSELIQVVNCPSHVRQWGEFNDYGHWGGGPWCGQTGKEGYWVWLAPNWYVWAHRR